MLATLVTLAAAEGEEPSKTVFFICGGALAAFAVVLAAVGIARHRTFPPSKGAARGVMALAFVLVAATMVSAVVTS